MKICVNEELFTIANQLLEKSPYSGMTDFTNNSDVPYSIETTRRFFSAHDKGMSADTIAIILRHLGCSKAEIKFLLQTYTTDQHIWPLIDDSIGSHLTIPQANLLEVVTVLSQNKEVFSFFTAQLEMLDQHHKLGLEDKIDKIKRLQ